MEVQVDPEGDGYLPQSRRMLVVGWSIGRIQCVAKTLGIFSLKIVGRLFFVLFGNHLFLGILHDFEENSRVESKYDDGCFCEKDLKHLCFDYVPTDPWIIWPHRMSLVL